MAVRTDQVLLSTGAWMDFSQHVHTLLLGGKIEEARTLWDSVFEVVHMGVDPSTPVLQSPDMPPIRRMPCCKTPRARCENRRGVPVPVHWDMDPQSRLRSRSAFGGIHLGPLPCPPHETLDLVAVQMYASGHSVQDFIPEYVAKLSDRLARGDDGVSQSYFFAMWRFWQNGSALWDEPVFFVADQQGPLYEAGRFLRMLLGAEAAEVEFIPPICMCGLHGVSELWDSLVRRLQEGLLALLRHVWVQLRWRSISTWLLWG